MPREHARMLAGAGDQADRLPGRRQREIRGLSPARREDDTARRDARQFRDRTPRFLDDSARGAALGMDRGGIAGEVERRGHRRARLGAQRRGRVVIEIGALAPQGRHGTANLSADMHAAREYAFYPCNRGGSTCYEAQPAPRPSLSTDTQEPRPPQAVATREVASGEADRSRVHVAYNRLGARTGAAREFLEARCLKCFSMAPPVAWKGVFIPPNNAARRSR